MSREDLTAFRFIDACNDKRPRERIFDLKRKDATAIKDTVAQYDRQQKAEAALRNKAAPLAAVKPNRKGDRRETRNAEVAAARPTNSATAKSLRTERCAITAAGLAIWPGCAFPPYKGSLKQHEAVGQSEQSRTRNQNRNIWVNRLTLGVSHSNGSFNFRTFPDTGRAATLIAADLARRKNVKPTKPSNRKYINISGDPALTSGTAPINLSTSKRSVSTRAVITPAILNEVIVGRDDLKELGLIPRQFPDPVFIVSENQYSNMRNSLIQNNPDVLTDNLPKTSMDTGCVSMKIHLTPGDKTPFRISTARQIPLHWREKAERILRKLLDGGVITQQDNPTEWCAPGFFVAKKNGDMRLVGCVKFLES